MPPVVLSENFRALFYAPFYASVATGAFADHGVEVVLAASPEPAAAVRALREGAVDVMWGGPLRVMVAHDADPASDLVCFADVVARDPFFVIGAVPRPGFRLADLATVRFSSVSEVPTPWICFADDLRRAGVDPESLNRLSGPTMAENASALRRGELDAVQLFQPEAEALLASGAGHLWYAAANRGPTAYTTLVTRRATLERRRGDLLGMTRGLADALQWFAATPAGTIADRLRPYFPEVDPALFAAAIDRYRGLALWAPDPVIPRAGYDRLHAAMRAAGALRRDVSYEACIDTGLALEALGKVG